MRTHSRRSFLARCAGLAGAALPLRAVPALAWTTPKRTVEMHLLGFMILCRGWIELLVSPIRSSMRFRSSKNRVIFESILRLYDEGKPIDLVALSDDLKRQGRLHEVGGPVYLSEIVKAVPNPETLEANLNRGRRRKA